MVNEGVASAAGFSGVDVMRRAFVRLLAITPRRYREPISQRCAFARSVTAVARV
jgi:transcriptional regulator GlxA family with amidase domain